MPAAVVRIAPRMAGIAAFFLVILFFYGQTVPWRDWLGSETLRGFKTVLISILLEALPFMLLGVAVSSLVQLFVSEQAIRRLVPRNPAAGVLFACLLGFLFPLCECGMLPVVRRLIRKGMPVYIAIVFILAGPVLNPITFASTYTAFRGLPEMAYARMALAFAVALAAGLLLARFVKKSPLRENGLQNAGVKELHGHGHSHGGDQTHTHGHGREHTHTHTDGQSHSFAGRLTDTLFHAADEFFEMGKYLVIGSMLAAGFQTFIDRESLQFLGQGTWSGHFFMLGLAYVLSLCSTSDAFVASSFAGTFTKGSLLTFLVFGPMMDLKGTLMLLSAFRTRFVLILLAMTAVFSIAGSMFAEHLFFR